MLLGLGRVGLTVVLKENLNLDLELLECLGFAVVLS